MLGSVVTHVINLGHINTLTPIFKEKKIKKRTSIASHLKHEVSVVVCSFILLSKKGNRYPHKTIDLLLSAYVNCVRTTKAMSFTKLCLVVTQGKKNRTSSENRTH